MEVTYSITEADYLKAMAYAENRCQTDLNRSLYMKVLLGIASIALALAAVSVIGLYQKYGVSPFQTDLNWFFGFLMLGIIAALAYLFRFRALSRESRLTDLGRFPLKQRIAVDELGIVLEGKYGRAN